MLSFKPTFSLRGKDSACNAGAAGDMGLIPWLGRSPGGGQGNPLHYSYLENPMDRRAWRAMVHGITKSWTRLKRLSMQACIHAHAPFCPFKTLSTVRVELTPGRIYHSLVLVTFLLGYLTLNFVLLL